MFGKDSATVGSAPNADVVLNGPGIGPSHARIVKQNNQLHFIDHGQGPSFANGAPVAPNQPIPFDFRTAFAVGQVTVPLSHPAIVAMLFSKGNVPPPQPGHVVIGREAARSTLVISHTAVSSQHATVMLDRMMVVDSGSTSGTYLMGQQIPKNQPVPIDPNGVIAFGPVPVPVSLLMQFAQQPHAAPQAAGGPPVPTGQQ